MHDFVIKLPLAMRFYLIGLIYRDSRIRCLCLASLIEVAHDRLYRVLYLAFPFFKTDVGMVCSAFGQRRLFAD